MPTTARFQKVNVYTRGDNYTALRILEQDISETCCNMGNSLGCLGCSSGSIASCKGRLPSYIHYFIYLVEARIEHDESVATQDFAVSLLRQMEYDKLLFKVNELGNECILLAKQDRVTESYHKLHRMVSEVLVSLKPSDTR